MKSSSFELCSKLFSSVCKLPVVSIKLNYPGFFTTFQFALFHFILFLWSVILSCEFTLSKGKNFEETLRFLRCVFCVALRRYITILLHLHSYEIKLPFFWQILLEIKILPLIFQMLAFLGTLFILTIRIFEALPQTNHSILRNAVTE